MLQYIEEFLIENMPPEYVKSRMQSIRLIHLQGLISPLETLVELIDSSSGIPLGEVTLLIDEVVDNFLDDILANLYIITSGDIRYKTLFLQTINQLEDYIDSEVILDNYDSEAEPSEALLKLMNLVSSESIEYFDEFLTDVRPALLTQLIQHHQDYVDSQVEGEPLDDKTARITAIKELNERYPNTIVFNALKDGSIKLERSLPMLLTVYRSELYQMTDSPTIAANLYALVLVSDTPLDAIAQNATALVTELYNEIDVVSEIKHHLKALSSIGE